MVRVVSSKDSIILNGLTMNIVSQVSYGLQRCSHDETYKHGESAYRSDHAVSRVAGRFHILLIAYALGHCDYSFRTAPQPSLNDPLLLVLAMAATTRRLGFGDTVSTTYDQAYLLTQKFITLVLLTKGRIAGNVVTSVLETAAKNLGLECQMDRDERYDRALEFRDAAYLLLEGAWEDDDVVLDLKKGICTDLTKVHPTNLYGRCLKVPGVHLSHPILERTPLLLQAGTSPRGLEFAAGNVGAVFLGGTDTPAICRLTDAIRKLAAEYGRATLANLNSIDAYLSWTVERIAESIGPGRIHPKIVGSPKSVPAAFDLIVDEGGIDGSDLAYGVSPVTFKMFVEYLFFELRKWRRIRARTEQPVNLCKRFLSVANARLRNGHSGAAARDQTAWEFVTEAAQ